MEAVPARGNPYFGEFLRGRFLETWDALGRKAERESASEMNQNKGLARIVADGCRPWLYPIRFASRSKGLLVLPVEGGLISTGRLSHGAFSIL
jgi:hypothetical protein